MGVKNIPTIIYMKFLNYALLGLALLGMYYVFCGYTEGFITKLSGSEFIMENTDVLLEDEYTVKGNAGLSENKYSDNSKKRSVSRVGSFEQVTNNVREWSTPDNGNCSTADFCDTLYVSKIVEEKSVVPQPNDASTRVNYFNIQ